MSGVAGACMPTGTGTKGGKQDCGPAFKGCESHGEYFSICI